MKIRLLGLLVAVLLLSAGLVGLAQATIYTYVDDGGVIHFTNVPVDPKFAPVVRPRPLTTVQNGQGGAVDPSSFDGMIRQAAKRYRIDPRLIKSVIRAESNFDSLAISSKGALGLMQLMPETAVEMAVLNPFDPKENIYGGTRYLHKMLGLFNGDLRLALAAYNAGPGRVFKLGGVPLFKETENYIRKVQVFYQEYIDSSSPSKRWVENGYDQNS